MEKDFLASGDTVSSGTELIQDSVVAHIVGLDWQQIRVRSRKWVDIR